MDMRPEEYPTAHNIEAGNVVASINHLREIARQMTVSANLGRTSGEGEQAEMTTKAVEVVASAIIDSIIDDLARGDANDMQKKFEKILHPVIDVRAPYAKVMVGMLVKAALGK